MPNGRGKASSGLIRAVVIPDIPGLPPSFMPRQETGEIPAQRKLREGKYLLPQWFAPGTAGLLKKERPTRVGVDLAGFLM